MSPSTDNIGALVAGVLRAPDDATWQTAFRGGFDRLRSSVELHPAEATPAKTFTAAARTTRAVAAVCLPLGVAVVMHLYALCALRCVPLPWLSPANFRRRALLQAIDDGALILANTASERVAGANDPVTVSLARDGIRLDGTCAYMSLAHVADVVLLNAPLPGSERSVFCAADLRRDSARIGSAQFSDTMRLSDTCPVSFENHRVAPGRYLIVPNEATLNCMAQYQRSWFQLLLAESYLARIEHLHERWGLTRPAELLASLQELACLREYAMRLLDAGSPAALAPLYRVTTAMKLRVSWHAQSTAAALRGRDDVAARELGFIRRQPTSDDRILQGIAERHCDV